MHCGCSTDYRSGVFLCGIPDGAVVNERLEKSSDVSRRTGEQGAIPDRATEREK
jgi:hypothetical protein